MIFLCLILALVTNIFSIDANAWSSANTINQEHLSEDEIEP
jgi:hypothetical protein